MKVLWIQSSAIGPAARILGIPYGGSSGTWIQSEYDNARKAGDEITFLCPITTIKQGEVVKCSSDEGIAYGIGYKQFISYGLSLTRSVAMGIEGVIKDVSPDVIHLWGTESSFITTAASLAPNVHKVIFIQGLIGIHQRYLSEHYLREKRYAKITFRQWLYTKVKHHFFKAQIPFEQSAILSAKNVITDTKFAQAYCFSFAPQTKVFHHFTKPANVFYNKEWKYANCNKNTVFTCFGSDPAKGFAQLFKALVIVKRTIPTIRLLVPGPFPIDGTGHLADSGLRPFEKWLRNFIYAKGLLENVFFLGKLSPEEMAEQVIKCNVYVSPSCMEVQSTSVREAMVEGAPVISSVCGCMLEYIRHGVNGLLYRYEEEEILAQLIIDVLSNPEEAVRLGSNARKSIIDAEHQDGEMSFHQIYKEVLS